MSVLWYPTQVMLGFHTMNFYEYYSNFETPIEVLDCGKKCAPYNELGVPFCCDTKHMVPTAYHDEWKYLQENTDLWHLWHPKDPLEFQELRDETPDSMELIECLGYQSCQRDFRSLTCRAFPFFPYLNSQSEFIGLSYYWEYEDRCWVINNLQVVTDNFRHQFVKTFDRLFSDLPEERRSYSRFSAHMRRIFSRKHLTIPLLHREGDYYKISPSTEKKRRIHPENFPKFGVYKIATMLPFPDEMAT